MKTAVIVLLAAALLAACVSPAMAERYYTSTFTAGTDGWYARGAQNTYRTTEGTLRTEGRSSDWHSPGRDFPLVEGCLYSLSVEVYQNEADSAAFMISIAHTKDGTETYENLAHGTVPKGEWTRLEGTYTAGDFEDRQKQGDGSVWEIEDAMAETVGAATVAKIDHHGNSSMCEKLVATLRSQVYVGCIWDWFHVDDATMTRLADRSLYDGERLLCPGILTKERRVRDALRPWLKDVPEACFEGAHVVVDVLLGGKEFSVSFVSAADESMRVESCIEMRTRA